MTITLTDIWKSYGTEWILRNVNYEFQSGNSYAILGPNGSGKSTLLQLVAGNITASKGTITYHGGKEIKVEDVYQYLGFSSPYMQLMEEFTLAEQVQFHGRFRPFINQLRIEDVVAILGMDKHLNKYIGNYSSGMKQRVKLALSILGQSSFVLLDEPATNLDDAGVKWFQQLLNEYLNNRLLIVSANRPEEYGFCNHILHVGDYK